MVKSLTITVPNHNDRGVALEVRVGPRASEVCGTDRRPVSR
jgi:hypothetical protein